MMKEKEYFRQLMADYNQIKEISEENYNAVFQKLILRRLPKNFYLKESNKPDGKSRYICEGFVGLYTPLEDRLRLDLIFGPTDTALDELSYYDSKPSELVLKTITDTVLFEFTLEAEKAVLVKNPEFHILALRIAHRINQRNCQQYAIKALKFKNGFPKLRETFEGIDQALKNQELADYFNCSISTIERLKNSQHKVKKDG
ncbi:Crp/Fnr family transcriptional regulator [Algoriphagus formosus]|uniref:Crp/Fnr family transcriptional regulator n=1 Tax=Algoriphagus formosus TaxID=2007308 RepID=A0A4R5USG1_9BACT|nr:Crp/Fnr family transcriptional regulator [Algoriphagus aquimaris]TDK42054.1 Crp/Fnr family transcriptional regulator [Algoriphagus aquimaris]